MASALHDFDARLFQYDLFLCLPIGWISRSDHSRALSLDRYFTMEEAHTTDSFVIVRQRFLFIHFAFTHRCKTSKDDA
jgi:hypothetical protein